MPGSAGLEPRLARSAWRERMLGAGIGVANHKGGPWIELE
jgi:hypothetical protein